MTINEAFSATGYFFEGLLQQDEEARRLFKEALDTGNKPNMWQGLNSLPGNFVMIAVAPEPA